MSSTSKQLKTVQLNGQTYEVQVKLLNTQVEIPIPTGIIMSLEITDSIYSVFSSGTLTINSTSNVVDTFVFEQKNELNDRIGYRGYSFNTDSRDTIHITIRPVHSKDQSYFLDHIWKMEYNFSIYDEDEVVDNRGFVKSKTFFLREEPEDVLTNANIQWSTTNVLKERYRSSINLSHIGNELRKVKTGLAISNLLKTTLPGASFTSDFDPGRTSIFYTSGPQQSAFDDLEYLLDRHVCTGGDDPGILGRERSGQFFLDSFESLYKNCYTGQGKLGPYVVDAYNTHLGEVPRSGDIGYSPFRRAFGFTSEETNQLDGLTNFSYLNSANSDSLNQLITTLVHNHNKGEKQFTIDSKDNHIYNIRKKSQELYADKTGIGDSGTPEPVIPLNQHKLSNKILSHAYSFGRTKLDRLHRGVNKVLKNSFAFAPSISFDTEGATNRRTSRFVMMTAALSDKDSSFAKLFVGEWLITKVVHVFIIDQNSYLNSVACVKPQSSDKLDRPEWTDMYSDHYDFLVSQLGSGERIV